MERGRQRAEAEAGSASQVNQTDSLSQGPYPAQLSDCWGHSNEVLESPFHVGPGEQWSLPTESHLASQQGHPELRKFKSGKI